MHYKQCRKQLSTEQLIGKFHKTVQEGPVYICTSCYQLLYRHSVSVFTHATLENQNLCDKVPNLPSVQQKTWICQTCKSYLKKDKIPPMSIMNKMTFPEQGPLKNINPLEQNLLAVRQDKNL